MASKWLTSQKKRDTHDIRNFIPVIGKIVRTEQVQNSVLQDSLERTNNLKQSSIKSFIGHGHSKVPIDKSRPKKAPASTFTTGVRKRTRNVVHSEDEETKIDTTRCLSAPNTDSINNKENVQYVCPKSTQQEACEPLHFKQSRKRKTSLDACATDSTLQWFELPPVTQETLSHPPSRDLNDSNVSPLSKKYKLLKTFTDFKTDPDPQTAVGATDSIDDIVLDSDVYIDTNELLANLSNCEKIIFDHD